MTGRVVFILCCISFVLKVSAQKLDSIQPISAVEIKADRISSFLTGLKTEKIDSTSLSIRQGSSLAALLTSQSAFYLRSYGPGGLSTLTMRGTNAAQSGVFWNGINLNQPNMGMTDLSRISAFEFSDVTLQSGGASALLGSGVIGGSLHLSNSMQFSVPLQSSCLLSAESSGKLSTALKLNAGSSRLAYNGSFRGELNPNNFGYTTYNGDRNRLDHALARSVSTIHEFEYIINNKQRLKTGFWYQTTDRQIPPTLTMTSSDQQQWDQAIRSSLQWSYAANNQLFVIKTAYIDEKEHYQSPSALIDAFYHLKTFYSGISYKRNLGKQILLGSGFDSHLIQADVPYYNGITYQPDGAWWLSLIYSHQTSGIRSALNLRQDFYRGYKIPFCPSVSFEVPVSKKISANLGVSRNFRVPTMNDRYWMPGGNPELKPEDSWNIEAGVGVQLHTGETYQSKLNLNIYSLFVDNLIQWVPGNSGIWSAANVQKVWSRGMELSSKTDFKFAGFKGYFKFAYNYTPSTYRNVSPDENEMRNKQLIYIPLHKVNETFYFSRGAFYSMFSYTLTGKRYVQSDNTKSLPSFALLDVFAGTSMHTHKLKLRFQAGVQNLLNVNFQSVLFYPEPGISFSASVLISKL